ncbi:MAG: ferrous iron transport protein A [Caldilineaceae bacterium]|nr:ferrous iron transport protein A [Caldilineaceae bacterium]MCB0125931.1 ferrous iron transport protein A [Caldilineaceae bacterium]MCB0185282.1 ferrous iron transport protein A [Caldilineaceae bacterium]
MTLLTDQISLDQLPLGQLAEVVHISAEKATRRRLLDLGVLPGVDLRVLQSAGGPLLVAVRDSRLAIGRAIAQSVVVKIKEGLHG